MIGIVIVSHSKKLAEGVYELAQQMLHKEIPFVSVGGIDDPENPIGTDPIQVMAAIESVYSQEGVLVLMDMGSALLSAETAIDLLPEEMQKNIYLCAAPFVEGTISATIQASLGSNIEQIIQEAMSSLSIKEKQLNLEPPTLTPPTKIDLDKDSNSIVINVTNINGLHARPSAVLVATAAMFKSNIIIRKKDGKTANTKSVNQVGILGIKHGEEIEIIADGIDSEIALDTIKLLAQDNFGESETEPIPQSLPDLESNKKNTCIGGLQGIVASSGVTVSKACLYQPTVPEVQYEKIDNPKLEINNFKDAIDTSISDLKNLIIKKEGDIFNFHKMMLEDPELINNVNEYIQNEKVNAAYAVQEVFGKIKDAYSNIEDQYLNARNEDVADVERRVLLHLTGQQIDNFQLTEPSVLMAKDIHPSDITTLDAKFLKGICTESGSTTSHTAIIARTLGIPAILGIKNLMKTIKNGSTVGMDAESGILWYDVEPKILEKLSKREKELLHKQTELKKKAKIKAITADGTLIEVAANIGGVADIDNALNYGAEAVGLFRTEFMFMKRETAPSEEEQYNTYVNASKKLDGKPLIIRTLDIGGDKPVSYIKIENEDNPFLGLRGIRLCLVMKDLFKVQLRAILRAGYQQQIKIMFPMIGCLDELLEAKMLLAEVKNELKSENIKYDANMSVGIMVEVPSAVMIADQLAQEVDFFSIGTNDLSQYVMAADRGNANVSTLPDALQPAVLRFIQQTVLIGHEKGIWVGMCGELAGNCFATKLLVGLGLDELSMSAPSVPEVKEQITSIDTKEAQIFAKKVLTLSSADKIKEYLKEQFENNNY